MKILLSWLNEYVSIKDLTVEVLSDKLLSLGFETEKIIRMEKEDDCVLDLAIPASRPDCQSVYGMAREIASALGRKLNPLDLTYKTVQTGYNDTVPDVLVKDKDACPLYLGSYIKNVVIEPSPIWMQQRLAAVGIKPINNIVDITNYVLIEVGQPLHAFDVAKIDKNIIVRLAYNGEKLTALDEKEYTLTQKDLVIADEAKALAIAGVMGGAESGINENTRTVFLEAARFARGGVRGTSRALGLSSDSSKRYEKGVDYFCTETGRSRALALFDKLKAGQVTNILKSDGVERSNPKVITTSAGQINSLLGVEVPAPFITRTLKALGFDVTKQGKNLAVTVPLYREDVDNYTDLAEEVIRFYGYDKLIEYPVTSLPMTAGGKSTLRRGIEQIEKICCGFGAYEIKSFSFINPSAFDMLRLDKNDTLRNCIRLMNPVSEEYSVMRTTLLPSMLQAISLNCARGNKEPRLFEIENVFKPIEALSHENELPDELKTLCAAFVCENQNKSAIVSNSNFSDWQKLVSEPFYAVKNLLNEIAVAFKISFSLQVANKPYLHPGVSAEITAESGLTLGYLGKIHPLTAKNFGVPEETYVLELNLMPFIDSEPMAARFSPLPKFPAVERDISFIVDDSVTAGEVLATAMSAADIIKDAVIFDIYKGTGIESGKKSVSLRLTLLNPEKTLVEAEINSATQAAVGALKLRFGGQQR